VVGGGSALKQEPASPISIDSSPTPLPSRPGSRLPVVRVLLGLILVFGAYAKLHFNGAWHFRDYYFFLAAAIGSYRKLPFGVVEWLARVLPWVELTLGALLIAGVCTRWVSLVASALLVFMASLPRAAILGLVNHTNPATELLVDTGFFLVAFTITLRAFHSHRAGQH
jgi:uncharacterized membrane protein YphA (DoxX/SURF4 family)